MWGEVRHHTDSIFTIHSLQVVTRGDGRWNEPPCSGAASSWSDPSRRAHLRRNLRRAAPCVGGKWGWSWLCWRSWCWALSNGWSSPTPLPCPLTQCAAPLQHPRWHHCGYCGRFLPHWAAPPPSSPRCGLTRSCHFGILFWNWIISQLNSSDHSKYCNSEIKGRYVQLFQSTY